MKYFAGLAAAIGMLACVPASVDAQPASRFLVGGTVDYARITDDESFLGSGVGVAGMAGWRFTDATSLEVEVGETWHVRDLDFFAVVRDARGTVNAIPYTQRWEGSAMFAIASLAYKFGAGAIRPVVWGGGGVMVHDGTVRGPLVPPQIPPGFTLQPGDAVTTRGERSRALTIDGGVGLDVRVASRLTLRPFAGLRLTNTDSVGPKYVARMGVRVGFH